MVLENLVLIQQQHRIRINPDGGNTTLEEAFIKMLPTNIAGSIGLAQLKKIDMLQARRKKFGKPTRMNSNM